MLEDNSPEFSERGAETILSQLESLTKGDYGPSSPPDNLTSKELEIIDRLNDLRAEFKLIHEDNKTIGKDLNELVGILSDFAQMDFSYEAPGKMKSEIMMAVSYSLSMLGEELENNFTQNLQHQLMLLGAQINPHFIFNALNSIQYYILNSEVEPAINYVAEFALLMRKILRVSTKSVITLEDEIQLIEIYLNLEMIRFKDKFTYQVEIDKSIDPAELYLPPMLIQPFVENAVLHGISPLENKGKIELRFVINEQSMDCIIKDNGVGRKKSKALSKQRAESVTKDTYGIGITETKLNILNRIYKGFQCKILDLTDSSGNAIGTSVVLTIPSNLKVDNYTSMN